MTVYDFGSELRPLAPGRSTRSALYLGRFFWIAFTA
jgi:hypothetical protein